MGSSRNFVSFCNLRYRTPDFPDGNIVGAGIDVLELGGWDSNPDSRMESQASCQLDDPPMECARCFRSVVASDLTLTGRSPVRLKPRFALTVVADSLSQPGRRRAGANRLGRNRGRELYRCAPSDANAWPKQCQIRTVGQRGRRREHASRVVAHEPSGLSLTAFVVVADESRGVEARRLRQLEGAVVDDRSRVHLQLPDGRPVVGCLCLGSQILVAEHLREGRFCVERHVLRDRLSAGDVPSPLASIRANPHRYVVGRRAICDHDLIYKRRRLTWHIDFARSGPRRSGRPRNRGCSAPRPACARQGRDAAG